MTTPARSIFKRITRTSLRLGDFRRVMPFSRDWGFERGLPIDRYYIEQFLAAHAADIRGRCLEIAENTYTLRFGGERVERADVLHVSATAPGATIIADLTDGRGVPTDAFDCIVCTQTLPFIFDVRAAIRTLHRALKPGGVLLATFAGISKISGHDDDRWGDYWRFTSFSAQKLFAEFFPSERVAIQTSGNALATTAFLYGLAAEELTREELDHPDADYEMLITLRAVKPD